MKIVEFNEFPNSIELLSVSEFPKNDSKSTENLALVPSIPNIINSGEGEARTATSKPRGGATQ